MFSADIPGETRRAVLHRARGYCEQCGVRCLSLEVHHLRYFIRTNRPDKYEDESIRGREEPEDLKALCRECHKRSHIDWLGQWWNDPEEMEAEWSN